MPNKIGRFEILSEITHSEIGSVYKASDPESGQTVALKTIRLELLGEHAAALVQHILEEAETTKALNSHNITVLYGAGEMEGQLVACMEYVQGNSVATMLARKEGFSIWDLQDIARQTCQGLDHAHVHHVVHHSLEPAKIMVQWDGVAKMLGFGTSAMGAYAAQASGKPPEVLHYMSPEQLRGDPLDARSNLFSLGAILYEMVTERKAFNGEDADQVRQSIAEMTPVAPDQINRKIHPALSEVIMRALAKTPEERYKSGQDLVNDLERCKESATKAAAKKPAQPPQGLNAPQTQKPAPAAKAPQPAKPAAAPVSAAASSVAAKVELQTFSEPPVAAAKTSRPGQSFAPQAATKAPPAPAAKAAKTAAPAAKAAAAAAGWPGANSSGAAGESPRTPKLDPSAQFISSSVKATLDAISTEEVAMSAAPAAEPEVEAPSIAVDPMMAEDNQPNQIKGRSFSEIDELPPLKEIYIAPAPPAAATSGPAPPALFMAPAPPEKPKVQPREVAKKAVREIKKTPPKLFGYSIAAAVGIILVVVVAIAFHIHSENSDDEGTPVPSATPASTARPDAAGTRSAARAPARARVPVQVAPEPVTEEPSPVSVTPKYNKHKKAPAPAPVAVPGQLTINSTPEGAQVHVDGHNDPSWVTPINLTGLAPGQHTVSVSRPGFSPENRTLNVTSGSKSFLVIQLASLAATVSVASEPAGAAVFLDAKDTGRVTPAQISVDKPGSHTLLLRKAGYLEETTTANLQMGQTFHFSPTLHLLGSTDEIKTVSKFKKMFGGGGASEVGTVSIKTQPKSAQIAVNRRILDKGSPVEFYLNPGTYVIDITMSGYKTIHRVINVDKGGKVAMDESLERE